MHDIGVEGRATHISLVLSHNACLIKPQLPSLPWKDIGKVPIVSAPSLPHNMASTDQQFLREIRDVNQYNPVSESLF